MELIRSTLGDECDLPARRSSFVGAGSAHCDAKFLNRIKWDGKYCVETRIDLGAIRVRSLIAARARCRRLRNESGALVVVPVRAVERDVILIAARSKDFTRWCDSHLQAQQLDNISCFQGQLADLLFRKRVSYR